ncbi:hypothetical protein LEN26_020184 [Aphanomyces euteiches]|nr:hypothetical protein LEN26_020184 [Aphanomyces euteiches]
MDQVDTIQLDVVGILNALVAGDDLSGLFAKNAFSALLKHLRSREGAVLLHRHCGELTIVGVLRRLANVAVVQSYGFVLVRKLCCVCMESNRILVDHGALELISEALRRFPNDTILQASACGALLPFVKYVASSSIDAVLSLGVLPLLVRLFLFQSEQHPRQIVIYAAMVLVEMCDHRGQVVIDRVLAATALASDNEWRFVEVVVGMLKASLKAEDDRKFCCALCTLLLCFMAIDRTVTRVVEEIGAIQTVSHAMVKYANDAGIVKYSSTVCQQLAKSSKPSPKKLSKTRKLSSPKSPKTRPADGVVYDVQLPTVSTPTKDAQSAARLARTYGIKENKLLSAYGFAKPTEPREPKQSLRPSPSDPTLPSLGQKAQSKSEASPPSRQPMAPVSPPNRAPSKTMQPSPPKPTMARAMDASPRAKKGGSHVVRAATVSPRSQQINVDGDFHADAKAPSGKAHEAKRPKRHSTGASPKKQTPRTPPRPDEKAHSLREMPVVEAWKPMESNDSEHKDAPILKATNSSGKLSPLTFHSPGIATECPPDAEESTQLCVQSSRMAGQLVRGWIYETVEDIAFASSRHGGSRGHDVAQEVPPTSEEVLVELKKESPGALAFALTDVPSSATIPMPVDASLALNLCDDDARQGSELIASAALDSTSRPQDESVVENAASCQEASSVNLPDVEWTALDLLAPPSRQSRILDDRDAGERPNDAGIALERKETCPVVTVDALPSYTCDDFEENDETPRQQQVEHALDNADVVVDVAVSLLAASAVQSWIFETIFELSHRPKTTTAEIQAEAASLDLPLDVEFNEPTALSDGADAAIYTLIDREDDALDAHVGKSLLAGQLVQCWIYEAFENVVESTTSEEARPTIGATIATILSEVDISFDAQALELEPWEGQDGLSCEVQDSAHCVASSLLAYQLVQAWIYETIDKLATLPVVSTVELPLDGDFNRPSHLSSKAVNEQEEHTEMILSVEAALLASQLVRCWMYKAVDRVVQFSRQSHEHENAIPNQSKVSNEALKDHAGFDPPLGQSGLLVADDEDEDATDNASSVERAQFAHLLVQTWLYETLDKIVLETNQPLKQRSPPSVCDSVAPTDEPSLLSSQTTTVFASELSPSWKDSSNAVELSDDSELAIVAGMFASTLVRAWCYEAMVEIAFQSTRRQTTPQEVVDEAVYDDDFDEPSEDEQTNVNAIEDVDSIALALFAKNVVQAWIYDTLERIAVEASDAVECSFEPVPEPIHMEYHENEDLTMKAAEQTESAASGTVDDDLVCVQTALVAVQLVQSWLYGAMDRIAVEFTASKLQCHRPEDESPLDSQCAAQDVPALENGTDGNDGLDCVSIEASLLAKHFVLACMSEALHKVSKAFAQSQSDKDPQVSSPAALPTPDDDTNVEVKFLSTPPHDDVEGCAANPTRAATSDDTSEEVNVQAAFMARQLSQGWIYDSMERVVSTLLPKSEASLLSSSSALSTALVDGSDTTQQDVNVSSAIMARRLSQGWIYSSMDRILSDFAEDDNVLTALVASTAIDGKLQEKDDSMILFNAQELEPSLSVHQSLLARQLVQSWLYGSMAWIVDSIEEPSSPTKAQSPSTSALQIQTSSHAIDSRIRRLAAEISDACIVEGFLHASQANLNSHSTLFIDDGVLQPCDSSASLEPSSSSASILFFDDGKLLAGKPSEGFLQHGRDPDELVAIAFMVGQFVRSVIYSTVEEIAYHKSPTRHETPCPQFENLPMELPNESSLTSTRSQAPLSVSLAMLAGQLVQCWIFHALVQVLPTESQTVHEHDEEEMQQQVPVDIPEELRDSVEEQNAQELRDNEIEISFMAGQLVRLWLYETMQTVVEFSTRPHEHDAGIQSEAQSLSLQASMETKNTVEPSQTCHCELQEEEDHDTSSILLANLLVRAWVYEAMANVVDIHVAGNTSGTKSQNETPCVEVAPPQQGTTSQDEHVSVADEFDDCVALQVGLLANLLVRAWTSEVLENNQCQAVRACDPVESSTPRSMDAPTGNPQAWENDLLEVHVALTSNLLVKGWLSQAMLNVVDKHFQNEDVVDTASPQMLATSTTKLAQVMTESQLAGANNIHIEESTMKGDDQCTLRQRVSTVEMSELTANPAESLSDSRLEDTRRETSSRECEMLEVHVALMSNLFVRGWLSQAMLNAVDKTFSNKDVDDAVTTQIILSPQIPSKSLLAVAVEESTRTLDDQHTRQLESSALNPSETDNAMLQVHVALLSNLFVRGWLSQALLNVSDKNLSNNVAMVSSRPSTTEAATNSPQSNVSTVDQSTRIEQSPREIREFNGDTQDVSQQPLR